MYKPVQSRRYIPQNLFAEILIIFLDFEIFFIYNCRYQQNCNIEDDLLTVALQQNLWVDSAEEPKIWIRRIKQSWNRL